MEWLAAITPITKSSVAVLSPLGLDLDPERKVAPKNKPADDPVLAVYLLRVRAEVAEDSDEYVKIRKAVAAINNLPGSVNRIAVSFEPLGFGHLSAGELLDEVDWKDDKTLGFTHCLWVQVDSPATFKALEQSKTFQRWRGAYEPSLGHSRSGPQVMAFCVPEEVTATAAAPRDAYRGPDAGKPARGIAGRNGPAPGAPYRR